MKQPIIDSVLLGFAFLSSAEATPATISVPPATRPGSVRLVLVKPGELLRSEAKMLKRLKNTLARHKGWTVTMTDATANETAAVRPYWATTPATSAAILPEAWASVETVVALKVLLPKGKKPRRISRGLGSIAIFRPPHKTPVYVEQIEGKAGGLSGSGRLAKWISTFVSLAAASGGK